LSLGERHRLTPQLVEQVDRQLATQRRAMSLSKRTVIVSFM
jgi:hypothetical protein